MTVRHRIVGYGMDAEPEFVGKWTSDPALLLADLDACVEALRDWNYVEAEGLGRVAFDGDPIGSDELERARPYIEGLPG